MNYNTTNYELEEILQHFNKITGLRMTVFDTEKNVIAEYPKTHCTFCNFVHNLPGGKEKCENSNWNAFKICKEKQSIRIYKCHMGLIEVVLPLVEHSKTIGYVMFGQITNDKGRLGIIDNLIKETTSTPINYVEAVEMISKIKYHSPKLINAEIKILQLCCSVILSKQMIPYKKTLYDKITDYINETELRNIKISEMCKELNVSRTLVYAEFSKHNNVGIAEYIRNIKLKKAISLLREGNLSIKEIAYITGFNDSNHFIKTFKANYNLTPKEYQKIYEKI